MELLQTVYYVLGIVFFSSWILISIGVIVLLWIAIKKVKDMQEAAVEKVHEVQRMTRSEMVGTAVTLLAGFLVNKMNKKK